MKEWTGDEVSRRIAAEERVIVYLYTPLCGTCQLAKKMMVVAEAALGMEVGMTDLNYAPKLALQYEVESVPCLLIFRNGEVAKRVYAFQSVEHVYHALKDA
ncbi:thioredoxin family protein [Ectobacillus ponti]|uniref:Thioredoxin family protein n=1 Tax=Ectobacillus ponti TaxID=2961894 RepID=A0AA41X658_9BACI|nr:thioredoxin family protein [Ectobacillus ponti]MCP8969666.1 thioredoxin family protein [Ectobacillus ponti]